jgi:mono/diheme cytochrome c family protein
MKKMNVLAAVALSVPSLCLANPDGQKIFQQKCKMCHKVNGAGGKLGPDLTQISTRRDENYIREKLKEPTKSKSDSVMPVFDPSPAEVDAVVVYLKTLK